MILTGGGAVAAVSQRLLDEKKQLPKLQILIYPWLQLVDFHSLPSYNAHTDKRLELTVYDMIFYYLGKIFLSLIEEELELVFIKF